MFLRLKTAKRYFSLVELMVVIGLFSFFIVILTQFLLKATELWRYTESETEINVQAQTIFATMDNLFEQVFIPKKLPTSSTGEAVSGGAGSGWGLTGFSKMVYSVSVIRPFLPRSCLRVRYPALSSSRRVLPIVSTLSLQMEARPRVV